MTTCHSDCRGTYLGSAWSDFRQVKEVWEEVFAGKPYITHTLAISGELPLQMHRQDMNTHFDIERHAL